MTMTKSNMELLRKIESNDPGLNVASLAMDEFPGLEFIKNLVMAMNMNTFIKSLRMDSNYLDDECLAELSHIRCPSLISLSLQNNKFTSRGVVDIVKIPQLRVINISYNAVDDEGAIALSRMDALEHLNISFNSIGNRGVTALLGNRSIQNLEMEGNVFDEKGLESVFQNHTLFSIHARNNNISRVYNQKVKDHVATHRK
jgi:Ran GTPase-activating protein (RanGAP) involved in mRNA processing and transport